LSQTNENTTVPKSEIFWELNKGLSPGPDDLIILESPRLDHSRGPPDLQCRRHSSASSEARAVDMIPACRQLPPKGKEKEIAGIAITPSITEAGCHKAHVAAPTPRAVHRPH